MKKRIAALLLAGITAFAMTACASNSGSDTAQPTEKADTTEDTGTASTGGKLIVGTEAGFAPYEYLKGNEVVGVDMDIAKAIADELGMELEIQNMTFDGALIAVQQGKVDMVAAGVSVDPEREKVMDFSDNYVDSTEVIVVNAETKAVETVDAASLEGKRIGVQQGNIADLWVSNTENVAQADIVRYTTFTQAASDLQNDKIDCIVMDEVPAQEMVATSNGALAIVEGDPLFVDQYAIAVKKGNTELLEKINGVLAKLKEDGSIEQFIANHSTAVDESTDDAAAADENADDAGAADNADTEDTAE